jgi:hypothetical protein
MSTTTLTKLPKNLVLVIEITNVKSQGYVATMRHIHQGDVSKDKVLPAVSRPSAQLAQLTALRDALASTQANLRAGKDLELALPPYALGLFGENNKAKAHKALVTEIRTLLFGFKSVSYHA